MQGYIYGHNRTVYLRQLGRTYVVKPALVAGALAELDEADRQIVAAEVAICLAERRQPVPPIAVIRTELFGE